MPELPEVETIRRGLAGVILNTKITNVEVRKAKLVKGSVKQFQRALTGAKFTEVKRRGKLLALELAPTPSPSLRQGYGGHSPSGRGRNKYLLIHLKMTGQLIYQKKQQVIAGGHPSSLKLRRTSPHGGTVVGLQLPDKF